MAPKKTREEILEKKRLAERKRLEKINNDPILRAQLQEKERRKYLKRKNLGKIKPIREMSPRRQKIFRQKSRESSTRYYYKKKMNQMKSSENIVSDNNHIDEDYQQAHQQCSSSLPEPLDAASPSPINCASPSNSEGRITRSVRRNILNQTPAHQQSQPPSSPADDNLPSNSHITQSIENDIHDQTSARHESLSPSSFVSNKSSSSSRIVRRNILDETPAQEHGSDLDLTPSRDTTTPSPLSSVSENQGPSRVMKKEKKHISIKKKSPYKYLLRKLKYRTDKELKIKDNRIHELKLIIDRYRKQIKRLRNTKTEKKNTEQNTGQNTEPKVTEKKDSHKVLYETAKMQMKTDIKNFFEEDENSRLCPGKKQFITRHKIRKQKRYLNFSLQQLHEKFLKDHPEYKISYSFFCMLRPFWVVTPNVDARDTCLCTIHENMDLAVTALRRNGIIAEKSTYDVLKSLCCDPKNVQCLKRQCNICNEKHIVYREFDNSKESYYCVWAKTKKEYIKDGQSKVTIQSVKDKVTTNPKNIIEHFEKLLNPYMSHCANIVSQNCYIKNLKANLTCGEAIVHCDFSENYNTKYASEIQSFHFGSSRQQVTLHTSVIYYIKNGALCTRSFCTLSECLRHDAIAIWEHLIPILNFIENEVPEVNALHFISDSPSSQYRNRKMFYVMAKLHWNCPTLRRVIWNYTEKGHGKGAPDGVGGLLKRTADQIVAQGKDIPDIETLIGHLKDSCKGVTIEQVGESGILEKELLIPSSELKEFRGTMRVHQVVWDCNNTDVLAMRSLSCDLGECPREAVECPHGQHVGFYCIDYKTSCNDGSRASIRGQAARNNTSNSIRKTKTSRKTRTHSTPNLDHGPIATTSQNNQLDICLQSDDSFWAEVSSINNNGISDTITNDVLTAIHNNVDLKIKQLTSKNTTTKERLKGKSSQKNKAKNSTLIARCKKSGGRSFSDQNQGSNECALENNERQVHLPLSGDIAIPSTSAIVPVLSSHNSSGSKNKVSTSTDQSKNEVSFDTTARDKTNKKNKTRNRALIKSSKKSHRYSPFELDYSHAGTLDENNHQELCVQSDDSLWNKVPSEILMPTSKPNIITDLFGSSDSEDYNIF